MSLEALAATSGLSASTLSRIVRGETYPDAGGPLRAPLRARDLDSLYAVVPDTGCWIWQGRCNPAGYGLVDRRGYSQLAHRAFYEMRRGQLDPTDTLDHLCRNKGCVNPDHLEPVSTAENVRRAPRVKLSAAHVARLRAEFSDAPCAQGEVAAREGVARVTVNAALSGANWRDLSEPPVAPVGRGWKYRVTDEDVAEIRADFAVGKSQRSISRERGISQGYVSALVRGKARTVTYPGRARKK